MPLQNPSLLAASGDDAEVGRERLLASGVLDRFSDKAGPTVVEEAEAVSY